MTVVERGKYHLRELLPNGQLQLTIGQRPIHYQDGQGAWQPIDSTWVDSGIVGRPTAVTAAPIMVSVADDGLRRLHPNGDLNKYIEIGAPYTKPASTWQKVALGTPTRSGSLLTWTTANVKAYCWHAGHFIKMGFELLGGFVPANRQIAFPVGINGLTRSGSNILDGSTVVATLDAPVVYDLDNISDRRDITFSFTSVTIGGSSQPVLLMTLPDLTGMSRPLVDPTLTLQPDATAGIDNTIDSSSPNTNRGTTINLLVGAQFTGLIQFDLSSLPSSGIQISSTTLTLWIRATNADASGTLTVKRLTQSWTENGATWNKYDGTNNWPGGAGADGDTNGTLGTTALGASDAVDTQYDTSLTAMVKSDLGTNGWRLSTAAIRDFYSSDHTTSAKRPKLVIVYNYSQSVSGTLTSAGTLARQAGKALAGTLTSAGALARQAGKVLAGTLTSAGTLTRSTLKAVAGTLTSAGVVNRQTSRNLAGTLSSSGALSRLTQKIQGGIATSAGTLQRRPGKATSGAVSMAGTLTAFYQVAAPMCISVADTLKTNIALSDLARTTITLSDASCS